MQNSRKISTVEKLESICQESRIAGKSIALAHGTFDLLHLGHVRHLRDAKEGSDIFVEGEAIYSLRDGYTPPAATAPYLLDLSTVKLIGLKDWVAAQGEFKKVRGLWQENFR